MICIAGQITSAASEQSIKTTGCVFGPYQFPLTMFAFVPILPVSSVSSACRSTSSFIPASGGRLSVSPLRVQNRARILHRSTRTSMMAVAPTVEELKKLTGYKAVDDYVKSGMVVGLGTGSTAAFAVERLGQKLASGELKDIVAIPTSVRTKEQAESLSIPLVTLDTHPNLDVAIDGADEVDPALNLVKGRGGALLREKMVEMQAEKFIVIVDESKLVDGLGISGAMPVEVTPFCWEFNLNRLLELDSVKGCTAKLRMEADKPYVTDNDNYIVDLYFDKPMADPVKAAKDFESLVGVVEHGLFLDMSTAVIVAGSDGVYVKTL